MDIQDLRRDKLRQWIEIHCEGVVTQYAKIVKKQQSQIADMLDGRKSFGEKVASALEKKTPGMPAGYLINPESTPVPLRAEGGWPFNPDLKPRWDSLLPQQKEFIEGEVERYIRAYEAGRPAPKPKSGPPASPASPSSRGGRRVARRL